jgi:hypothetical protein
MATLSSVTLGIVRNVANADITVSYTISWSAFDQLTNLQYTASFRLIGDDTGQDGDNLPVGDDPIAIPPQFLRVLSSNGQASTTVNIGTFPIAFANLNEDNGFASAADNDDEIRAVVTLTPMLPVATSRESTAVVVTSP